MTEHARNGDTDTESLESFLSFGSDLIHLLDNGQDTPNTQLSSNTPQLIARVIVGRNASPPPMPSLANARDEIAAGDPLNNQNIARSHPAISLSPIPTNPSRSSSLRRPLPTPPSTLGHSTPQRSLSVVSHTSTMSTRALPTPKEPERISGNVLLSEILNETRSLVALSGCIEWSSFLALTQTCRAARNAVLKKSDNLTPRSTGNAGKGGSSHTASQLSQSISMSAPVRQEVLAAYVDGYNYLLGRIQRVISRPNTVQPSKKVVRGKETVTQSASRKVTSKTVEIKEMKVSLEELHLLYISSLTPLHVYPTNALVSLSRSPESSTQPIELTRKLQALTLVHSKFVLLLRNMADQLDRLRTSSSNVGVSTPNMKTPQLDIFAEQSEEDLFDALSGSTTYTRSRSVRELVFPAPLANSSQSSQSGLSRNDSSVESHQSPKPTKTRHARESTAPSSISGSKPSYVSPSKRLSLLRSKPMSPPPLPSEPNTLKAYSNGWRKSLLVASENHRDRVSRRTTLDYGVDEFGAQDSSWDLKPPLRRFASSPKNSSLPPSSSGSSSNVSSANSSRRNSINNSSGTSSPSPERRGSEDDKNGPELELPKKALTVQFDERAARRMSALDKLTGGRQASAQISTTNRRQRALRAQTVAHPSNLATSPHDLVLATSRLRAPVLRVYLPCTELSAAPSGTTSSKSSIQRIEAELIRAGVWEWMRGGEVVVNFGYMPGNINPSPTTQSFSKPQSNTRLVSTSTRESQIFSNFSPSPRNNVSPAPIKAFSILGMSPPRRSSGRLSEYFRPDSTSPPSSYRSTPNQTPGPSRESSSHNINGMVSHSRQSTLSNVAYPVNNPSRQSSYSSDMPQSTEAKWLIFNGHHLIPYSPSSSEVDAVRRSKSDESFLPLGDPLSLPSPFYYDHILGAEGKLKVRIDVSKFPDLMNAGSHSSPTKTHSRSKSDPHGTASPAEIGSYFREELSSQGHSPQELSDAQAFKDAGVSVSLQTIPTLLRSPGAGGAQGGLVRVRRWRWVATAFVPSEAPGQNQSQTVSQPSGFIYGTFTHNTRRTTKDIGKGWTDKTWILEGEGTKEGREMILSCLNSSSSSPWEGHHLEWEIVRDKSQKTEGPKGVLWFRLLTSGVASEPLDGDDASLVG